MKRFFLSPGAVQGRRMVFLGKDARYIHKVLRLRRGDVIIGFDGGGVEYTGMIAILSPKRVEAVITGSAHVDELPSCRVALAQALLKGGGLDGVIRQATELGISEFYPLATRYCIPRVKKDGEKRLERWRKIAIDAVRQSGRTENPVIHPVRGWREFLLLADEFDLSLLPWEGEKDRTLKSVLAGIMDGRRPGRILIAIGAEGGFTDTEVEEAVQAGFRAVSLGKSVLRATTAGIATVACVQYELRE